MPAPGYSEGSMYAAIKHLDKTRSIKRLISQHIEQLNNNTSYAPNLPPVQEETSQHSNESTVHILKDK